MIRPGLTFALWLAIAALVVVAGVAFTVGTMVTLTVGITVVGTAVTTIVVGTTVGTVVATGVAGWDVHPASKIPVNRIARTTRSFFMHLFLLFRYIRIFYYCVQSIGIRCSLRNCTRKYGT